MKYYIKITKWSLLLNMKFRATSGKVKVYFNWKYMPCGTKFHMLNIKVHVQHKLHLVIGVTPKHWSKFYKLNIKANFKYFDNLIWKLNVYARSKFINLLKLELCLTSSSSMWLNFYINVNFAILDCCYIVSIQIWTNIFLTF